MLKILKPLALLGLTVLLSACAGRSPMVMPEATELAHLPDRILLQDVPFHAQDAYQCGPASLAMVLNHRGVAATPDSLKDRVYLPERKGTLQVEMISAAREQDLLVYPLDKDLQAILTELAAGNPVLVMQNLAFNWYPQWHYAVVVGYDLNAREMLVHSGLNKAQREPFHVFMRTWSRADYWARVMLPPGQLPATARPLTYLRAASDLEQTGRLQSAEAAYRSAVEQWPDQPTARFGLGNTLWAGDKRPAALEQFQQLVNDFPDFQPGWNNLATGLELSGCASAAAAARQCSQQVPKPDTCAQLSCTPDGQ
ncbi:PA2778 family cysteine peptidase [Halopseudomonas formosensis]|uniref:PA2778 family cysteine peptidase n=1 Tax=Halopseudomonas formosensis TaxID=1002526 RepID=A0ABU5BVD9_9GAMM|nr:PA2778 family cysteine peptidase [Halopseudomonas formosensis]MDX9686737.1 PA2778 family cysteine peptidase [Halopseudomonas formosensis]